VFLADEQFLRRAGSLNPFRSHCRNVLSAKPGTCRHPCFRPLEYHCRLGILIQPSFSGWLEATVPERRAWGGMSEPTRIDGCGEPGSPSRRPHGRRAGLPSARRGGLAGLRGPRRSESVIPQSVHRTRRPSRRSRSPGLGLDGPGHRPALPPNSGHSVGKPKHRADALRFRTSNTGLAANWRPK
jgi:hypothetical protein